MDGAVDAPDKVEGLRVRAGLQSAEDRPEDSRAGFRAPPLGAGGDVGEGLSESEHARAPDPRARPPCDAAWEGPATSLPIPLWLRFGASILLVTVGSLAVAWRRVEARRRSQSVRSPVSQFLDPTAAFMHVGLSVANTSNSVLFYRDVLGGQEVGLPEGGYRGASKQLLWPRAIGDTIETGPSWRTINFGSSSVVLWDQAAPPAGPRAAPRGARLAFRLLPTAEVTELLVKLRERLQLLHGFEALSCAETPAPSSWQIVVCLGPDEEHVELWRPSLPSAKSADEARQAWAYAAGDARGRDLFE